MKKIIALLLAAFILSAFAGVAVAADAVDAYLVGDADGDGVIAILDATRIQRLLVDLVKDEDGSIAMRGDIRGDGVDILDATLIQRYVAGFDDGTNIGKLVYIGTPTEPATETITEVPTDPPTEPATQGATRDPDELPFVPKK